jgi:hypothetical protein
LAPPNSSAPTPRQLTLDELGGLIVLFGTTIGLSPDDAPTLGSSKDFAYPHLEADRRGYHWVVVERGVERERRTTRSPGELLYWTFSSITFSMASDWECANRRPNEDSRRRLFDRHVELMTALDPAWGHAQLQHYDDVLARAPFVDGQ